ncbi:MAG: Archaeal ATPase [Euryarchaeota archaeon ADurb.Bin294]|jgi:AAA+ ATPase superfamily predicted ATPase|nr:hypothetical protein [Methanomicrobiales archaeon]OQA52352.1 MAG: Archaeal ATPase [Euryarchaeota archaeon ADurb.Bin294]
MFLNREAELTSLQQRFDTNNAEFIIIYGRRRVGKSELIDQFIKKTLVFAFWHGKRQKSYS